VDIKLFDENGTELKLIRDVKFPQETFEKFWGPVFGASYWEPYVEAPSAESRLKKIRQRRDALLLKCDWTQGVDSPLSDAEKTAWALYRQELRDLTSMVNPFQPTWPVDPQGNQ
jgi:hypothetical protein